MTAKTRRPHRKSRNGCAECKHRHIRCDERRPLCANCEVAERTCSFSAPAKNKQKQSVKPRQQQEAVATRSPTLTTGSHDNREELEYGASSKPLSDLDVQYNQFNLQQALDHLSQQSLTTQSLNPIGRRPIFNPQQGQSLASPIVLSNVSTPKNDRCPGFSTAAIIESRAEYTSQHMILMHYVKTVSDFTRPDRSVVDIAIRHAVDSPYLLDEVLAFTAFQLSNRFPGSATSLSCLATELQNRALSSFTELTKQVPNDDKATATPRFLFSAILGRHVLADTLTHCCSDFHLFIDRFLECVNLNRGIRTVTPPDWDYLHETEVEPFLRVVREAGEKIVSPGHECDTLRRVMNDSDLNETSIKACRQAIDVLQWSFDLCLGLDEEDYLQAASVFSVRIGADYADVLRKHRPEALLILAYYGVLLYRCRTFVIFRDAGASMIRAIADHLGSYWQDALSWPLHVLEAESYPDPPTELSNMSTQHSSRGEVPAATI